MPTLKNLRLNEEDLLLTSNSQEDKTDEELDGTVLFHCNQKDEPEISCLFCQIIDKSDVPIWHPLNRLQGKDLKSLHNIKQKVGSRFLSPYTYVHWMLITKRVRIPVMNTYQKGLLCKICLGSWKGFLSDSATCLQDHIMKQNKLASNPFMCTYPECDRHRTNCILHWNESGDAPFQNWLTERINLLSR